MDISAFKVDFQHTPQAGTRMMLALKNKAGQVVYVQLSNVTLENLREKIEQAQKTAADTVGLRTARPGAQK